MKQKKLSQAEMALLIARLTRITETYDAPFLSLLDQYKDRYEGTDPESVLLTYALRMASFMLAQHVTIINAMKAILAERGPTAADKDYIAEVMKDARDAAVKNQGRTP